jgi:hypothetical protein
MSEIFLGNGDNLSIQTSKNVELRETLELKVWGMEHGSYSLDVKIIANFESIPEKYHEIFLNMMTSKYYGRTSFGDNPFSKCVPPKVKKWYQFWKQ